MSMSAHWNVDGMNLCVCLSSHTKKSRARARNKLYVHTLYLLYVHTDTTVPFFFRASRTDRARLTPRAHTTQRLQYAQGGGCFISVHFG